LNLPNCFKAYDIRGRVPDELNEDLAYRIGRAYVCFTGAHTVAVGQDMRLSSPAISSALMRGLQDQGADVIDIGLCGTEEVYFATFSQNLGGGIMVTASHNPADYNGLKIVREESRPISEDTGLRDIGKIALAGDFPAPARVGEKRSQSFRAEYVKFLLNYVADDDLKPLKIVTNAGNGCAGFVVDAIEPELPFELIKLQHDADGTFPNGVPNPLLPENRTITANAVRKQGADLGLAWDGDFDRCFFFDEKGDFIEGYYLVGLLATALLEKDPGQAIVYDPRLTWNTQDIVAAAGGTAVQSKSGHAFIKVAMRECNGLYGGEMSAHHYFRDFAYCDNGTIPWLLVAALLCRTGKPLSTLVAERQAAFPASGEINRKIADADAALAAAEAKYGPDAIAVDHTDGVSIEFADWRFNLRKSNTEPLVRLNVESRGDVTLMQAKTAELLALLDNA